MYICSIQVIHIIATEPDRADFKVQNSACKNDLSSSRLYYLSLIFLLPSRKIKAAQRFHDEFRNISTYLLIYMPWVHRFFNSFYFCVEDVSRFFLRSSCLYTIHSYMIIFIYSLRCFLRTKILKTTL